MISIDNVVVYADLVEDYAAITPAPVRTVLFLRRAGCW